MCRHICRRFIYIVVYENDTEVSLFLFIEDPFHVSNLSKTYRFTRVLIGVIYSYFVLVTRIKHHIKIYIEQFLQTVRF